MEWKMRADTTNSLLTNNLLTPFLRLNVTHDLVSSALTVSACLGALGVLGDTRPREIGHRYHFTTSPLPSIHSNGHANPYHCPVPQQIRAGGNKRNR